MGMAALKIFVLLPNIYYKEINWLYACLVLNAGLSYWLSFLFHIRSCVALQKPMKSVRKYQAWFGIKIFLLISIYLLSPLFTLNAAKQSWHWEKKKVDVKRYPFLMDCNGIVYRKYLHFYIKKLHSEPIFGHFYARYPLSYSGPYHNAQKS